MFAGLRARWRNRRIPLRVNILIVFLGVLAPLSIAVISYNYVSTRRLAVEVISERVVEINDRLVERQQRYLLPATSLAQIYADRFSESEMRALDDPGFVPGVLAAMALFPQLYAVYVGYDDGEFMHVIKFSPEELARPTEFVLPPGTRYAVRRITTAPGKREDVWSYLDERRKPIRQVRLPVTFDPRSRPWYDAAQRSVGVVAIAPYQYAASQQQGITFSAKLTGHWHGAVGVDLTTENLSDFLSRIRVGDSGHILVFGEGGALIAATPGLLAAGATASNPLEAGSGTPITANELLAMFVHMMANSDRKQMRVEIRGVDYLVDMRVLRLTDQSVFRVVVLAPMGELLAPIAKIALFTVGISGAIGLLAIPLILFLSARIAKPILLLAEDSRQIQQMRLLPLPPFSTDVTEVVALADAFNAMKSTLRNVTKYVPSAVVRDLLESKQEPVPGGVKRTISILFTDVQDFTRLSEGMPPGDLLRKATTYYHEVGTALIESGALIGRFMGDGIVAYWNASTDDSAHAVHAAGAVLHARSNSEALNHRWESYGWPIMHTRFGLHIGEAIVGNIGLPDRMDYTAFGDSLNIASRLEGLNKFYGTQILVSGVVANALRPKFTLRWVDRVAPKGTTVGMEILELLGMNAEEGDDFMRCSPSQVRMAARWDAHVIAPYLDRRWQDALGAIAKFQGEFPNDGLARIYAARCKQYCESPPTADWDGIVRYTEK